MKTWKIGLVGLGARGVVLLASLLHIPQLRLEAVCDDYNTRLESYLALCREKGLPRPFATRNYRELLTRDLDAVIISTTWITHVPLAVAAMRAGKHVGLEVGGALCEQDCWQLVRTSEETGCFCMMLENCCYGDDEMTVFHMARKGLFGEIVHAAGGYEHDLREQIVLGGQNHHGRMINFLHRNGDLYPTHQLGPVAKLLNINRGNRILTLVSMASKARGLHHWIERNHADDPDLMQACWQEGDVVTSILKCANGETIVLTHGCSLPRPYSRDGRVQGTRGLWLEERDAVFVEDPSQGTGGPDGEHVWTPLAEYKKDYRHPLWREYERKGFAKEGHNDMDYLVLCAFADSLEHGEPPIDVYDAATWMAVSYLSEQSVAMGGMPVPVPDFTCGRWLGRTPERRSKYALSQVCEECF